MKNKYFLIFSLLILQVLSSFAQDTLIGNLENEYVKWILKQSPQKFRELKYFDFDNQFAFSNKRSVNLLYLTLPINYPTNFTGLDYPTNQLIVKPNGTGRLYCIYLDSTNDKIQINRLDKTLYAGYNFYDYIFQRSDTIFSLGGEGFWAYNGQLRCFLDKKREWEVKPISRWFPVSEGDNLVDLRIEEGEVFTYFHQNKSSKYFSRPADHPIDSVLQLNLKNGDVKILGVINPQIEVFNNVRYGRVQTKYGLLIMENSRLRLLDFKNNRSLIWENSKINNIYNSTEAKPISFILADTTIYYFENDKVDSIIIPVKSFQLVGSVYTPVDVTKSLDGFKKSYFLIPFILLLTLIIFMTRKRKYISSFEKNSTLYNEKQPNEKLDLQQVFEIRELELIMKIIESQNMIDVDQMNNFLGVQKKSLEVQKRQRSQVISSINIKLSKAINYTTDLIIRRKNETDGREVVYQIDEKYLSAF